MILNPLDRRRAESFACRLDSDGPDHPHSSPCARASGTAEDELAELLRVTDALGDLREQAASGSRPSREWREATRRRLMAVAAAEGIGSTARPRASAAVPETEREPVLEDLFPRRPRGRRRLAIVTALLTATVAVSGVSAASGGALPGDTLYNVKRSTERAQLALAGDDLARAQLHLEFARIRIQEAQAVVGDDEAVARAFEDAAADLLDGVSLLGLVAVVDDDDTPLEYIDLFTNEHRWLLGDLLPRLDGDALASGEDFAALLEQAAVRSVELREALSCTEPGGKADQFGPLPGECVSRRSDDASSTPGVPATPEAGDGQGAPDSGGGSDPHSGDEATESPVPGADDEVGTVEPDSVSESPGDLTDDVEEPIEDGGVLDQLSGVISDLFG